MDGYPMGRCRHRRHKPTEVPRGHTGSLPNVQVPLSEDRTKNINKESSLPNVQVPLSEDRTKNINKESTLQQDNGERGAISRRLENTIETFYGEEKYS
ncbi:hypothetical protein QE152_g30436 [Popillia japonica]|uniref:Uncharacterized protein n=1 Tax=Popillia japonica TaxID=7064 RepID=A0AAW1JER5_POPJA